MTSRGETAPLPPSRETAVTFDRAYPWAVRSVRQRYLLNEWLRLSEPTQALPRRADFQSPRLREDLAELMFYDVVDENGAPRFMVTHEGASLISSFGFSGKGRFLDDSISPKLRTYTRPIYFECVARQRPVYSTYSVSDVQGRKVMYERLLLPFGERDHVDHMIASLKTISWQGAFDNKDLMRPDGNDPVYAGRSVIDLR